MAHTAALSSNQQGLAALAGIDMVGIFTITPDASCLVTGEPLDLTKYFATVDAVIPCGVSAIAAAGYNMVPIFSPGVAHTNANLLIAYMIETGNAGALTPANAVDLSTYTYQIMVFGKSKGGN